MNLFNKAFLAGLVVFSGSIFAACTSGSCGIKRSSRTAALTMQKVNKSRSGRVSRQRVTRQARKVMRSARMNRAVSGTARSAALGAVLRESKGGCKNGVCSR
jgi:hypothetical protein